METGVIPGVVVDGVVVVVVEGVVVIVDVDSVVVDNTVLSVVTNEAISYTLHTLANVLCYKTYRSAYNGEPEVAG